jgi:hypothetical protein
MVVKGHPFTIGEKEASPLRIEPECPEDAKELAVAYISAVAQGDQPHPLLQDWIVTVLEEVTQTSKAGNNNVLKALGLKRKSKGRPSDTRRRYDMAADVIKLMNAGNTLELAALELADKYGLHESNIVKAYSDFKDLLKGPSGVDDLF